MRGRFISIFFGLGLSLGAAAVGYDDELLSSATPRLRPEKHLLEKHQHHAQLQHAHHRHEHGGHKEGSTQPVAAQMQGSAINQQPVGSGMGCDCASYCKKSALIQHRPKTPALHIPGGRVHAHLQKFKSKTVVQQSSKTVCPPGMPCSCGCHCTGGAWAWAPAPTAPPPPPKYPLAWYMLPCPPWGCACRYGVCAPGVTHGKDPYQWIMDPFPIGAPGLPGGLEASAVGHLVEHQPGTKGDGMAHDCPIDPGAARPWYCPEPPPLP